MDRLLALLPLPRKIQGNQPSHDTRRRDIDIVGLNSVPFGSCGGGQKPQTLDRFTGYGTAAVSYRTPWTSCFAQILLSGVPFTLFLCLTGDQARFPR